MDQSVIHENVLVMGASPRPERYSFIAANLLHQYGHRTVLFGSHRGSINGEPILHEFPSNQPVDSVTMYLSARNQRDYEDAILALKPKRVIFNPGAENPEFEDRLHAAGIEPIEACTLVMLRTGQW